MAQQSQLDTQVAPRGTPLSVGELSAVAAAVGAFAIGYLLLARAHGALGIPRHDDWAYLRIAFDFSHSGHLALRNWGQMTLVGQVVMAAPVLAVFDHSITALQVMVTVMGAVAVVLSYVLVRSFLPARWAALSCALLLVGPIFATVSVSFMTDVPAYCVETLALLLGWRALARDRVSIGWLAASAFVGVVATSIHDNGALAFGAVLLLAVAKAYASGDRRRLRTTLTIGVAFVGVALVMLAWAHSLPHAEATALAVRPTVLRKMPRAVMTLALFISPCVLIVSPRRLLESVTRARRWLQVTFGAVLVGVLAFSTANFLGDYFETVASYQPIHEPRGVPTPIIVPNRVYLGLRIFAVYALVILMGVLLTAAEAGIDRLVAHGWRGLPALVSGPRSAAPLLTVFLFGSLVAQTLAMAVADVPLFDRYLIGLIPFAAGLTLAWTITTGLCVEGARRGFAIAGLVGLALVGLLVVDGSAATDGAKWALAEKAQALGYQRATINGGFEWFSFSQPDPVASQPKSRDQAWWIALFPHRPVCATVGAVATRGPFAHAPVLATQRATTAFGEPVTYVLRAGPDACGPKHP